MKCQLENDMPRPLIRIGIMDDRMMGGTECQANGLVLTITIKGIRWEEIVQRTL